MAVEAEKLAPAIACEPVRIPSAPDALTMYWLDNVAVVIWHAPPTAPVVDAWYAMIAPELLRHQKVSMVHASPVKHAVLDSATRDSYVRGAKQAGPHTAVTAVLAPALGFWASTLRSVVTGIMALSGVRTTMRFCDNAEEVLAWLPESHERATGRPVDLEQLRQLLDEAERQMRVVMAEQSR